MRYIVRVLGLALLVCVSAGSAEAQSESESCKDSFLLPAEDCNNNDAQKGCLAKCKEKLAERCDNVRGGCSGNPITSGDRIQQECRCIGTPKKAPPPPPPPGGTVDPCALKNDGDDCETAEVRRGGKCCQSRCVNRSRYLAQSKGCNGACPRFRCVGEQTCNKMGKCVCPEGKLPCEPNGTECCLKPGSPPPPPAIKPCETGGKEQCAAMGGQCCNSLALSRDNPNSQPFCGTCKAEICDKGQFGDQFCVQQKKCGCMKVQAGTKIAFRCVDCPPAQSPPAPGEGGAGDGFKPLRCYVNSPAAPCKPGETCGNPLTICEQGFIAGGFSANVQTVLSCRDLCQRLGAEGRCTVGCPVAEGFCTAGATPPCRGLNPGGIDDPAFDRFRATWGQPGSSVLCSCRSR